MGEKKFQTENPRENPTATSKKCKKWVKKSAKPKILEKILPQLLKSVKSGRKLLDSKLWWDLHKFHKKSKNHENLMENEHFEIDRGSL